jgi:Na+/glutamate symporter
LLHRRRGWIVAAVAGVAAWLTVAVMRGSLAPNGGHGAGAAVGSVMVVLLAIGEHRRLGRVRR